MQDRAYGDWRIDSDTKDFPSQKELQAKFGTHLKNQKYALALQKYLTCTNLFINQYTTMPEMMEKQINRIDIDAVCGFELFQMKKFFLEDDALEFRSFIPFSSDHLKPAPHN